MADKKDLGAQIEFSANADGMKPGVDAANKSIASIGATAEYVGNKSSASLEKVGGSAEKSAKQIAAATRSIAAQAERALATIESGGSISKQLEANALRSGASMDKLVEKIGKVREAEIAAARAATDKAAGMLSAKASQVAAEAEASTLAKRTYAFDQLRQSVAKLNYETEQKSSSNAAAIAAADEAATNKRIEAFERLRQSVAKLNYEQSKKAQSDAAAATAAVTASNNSYLASLEKTVGAIGKSRSEIVAMELAQRGLTERGAPLVAKLRDLDAATGQLGKSAFASRNRLLTLQYTISDVIASASSGISPLTILLQQGGQVFDAFGGANAREGTGFFKNFFGSIGAILTPARVAIAGVTVGVVALGLAMGSLESKARSLSSVQALFSGTGRGEFFSTDELNAFIQRLALAPGVTRDSATQIVSALAKMHDIGKPLLLDLAGITADYAKATGTDIPTAAKALAGAFGNIETGAKQIDGALGRVSTTTGIAIEKLLRTNDVAGAQRVLFDSLAASVRGLANDALTPLQKATNELGNSWERAIQALDNTAGIKSATSAVESLLDGLTAVINFLPNFEKKWIASFSGGINGAVLSAAKSVASLLNLGEKKFTGGATGSFEDGKPAPGSGGSAADDEIKRSLEAAKAFQSQASQISSLLVQRKAFEVSLKKSIELYSGNSEQANKLRNAIAGVDEKIKEARNKGGAASEAESQRKAILAQDLAALKDKLSQEQAALQFNQQFLQGAYQASLVSLETYYAERKQITADGVQAELAELSKAQARIQEELDRGNFKDPHQRTDLETQLAASRAASVKVQVRAGYELRLSTQEQEAATKALNDRVVEYRANLLQLSGDEEQAAKIRADLAIANARLFATTAGGRITDADLAREARLLELRVRINATDRAAAQLSSAASLAEESATLLSVQRGESLYDAERRIYDIRSKAVDQLAIIARQTREQADLNRENVDLQIRAADAEAKLAKAIEEMDPALNRLRSSVRDVSSSISNDIASAINDFKGFRPLIDAISKDLVRAGTDLFVTQPLKVELEGLLRNLTEGDNPIGSFFKGALGIQGGSGLTAQTAAVTSSTTALLGLTQAATSASIALGGQTATSTASGGGGFLGWLGSLFGGGSSAGGIAGNDIALAYHSGGLVGSGGAARSVSASMFAGARRFHGGGVPGLMQGEVPAILMGGPRGKREEVLRASDPRHSDNGGAQRDIKIMISQSFAPGTDRRTINQASAAAGREVQRALARQS